MRVFVTMHAVVGGHPRLGPEVTLRSNTICGTKFFDARHFTECCKTLALWLMTATEPGESRNQI